MLYNKNSLLQKASFIIDRLFLVCICVAYFKFALHHSITIDMSISVQAYTCICECMKYGPFYICRKPTRSNNHISL